MAKTMIEVAHRPKEPDGWRAGKPVEDPAKTKRWGFVTAKPSEFLVHVRRGAVRLRSSGQGATCFKWPRDAVAVVPTSLQRLRFTADQVTVEKVGVSVSGLAVYRIAEPLVAYRVLNFSYPERAQEKLEETLAEMFVGACRRLIANLSVDECLRQRKAALADELLREIAPVVGGEGSPDDPAPRGWGLVLDTIEIQEVRVLSEAVFQAMQAPYRTRLDEAARQARGEADKAAATREAADQREIAEARLAKELVIQAREQELAEAAAEARRRQALREQAIGRESEEQRLEAAAAVQERRREIERRQAEAETAERVAAAQRAERQAAAELEAHGARLAAQAKQGELDEARGSAAAAERRRAIERARLEGLARAEVRLAEAQAQAVVAEAEARVELCRQLPALAGAVGARFGEVNVTQIGGGPSPYSGIVEAVAAVVSLVQRGGRGRSDGGSGA